MNDLKLLGILCQTSDGKFIFVPISDANTVSSQRENIESGKIVRSPTPDEARVDKEKEIDHSLEGVLKKTKSDEVSKKEV